MDLSESIAWGRTTEYHNSPNEGSRLSVLLRTQKRSHLHSTMDKNLRLKLKCGHVSYAEIPNCFDVVLGVTGTLKGLSQREIDILNIHYSIK